VDCFLTSWETTSFSLRTLLLGFSLFLSSHLDLGLSFRFSHFAFLFFSMHATSQPPWFVCQKLVRCANHKDPHYANFNILLLLATQDAVLKCSQSVFFLTEEDEVAHTHIQNKRKNYSYIYGDLYISRWSVKIFWTEW